MNPYRGLPDYQIWRRGVAGVERHAFDPVVATKFRIAPGDRIATAGSCFAQHISRKLEQIGFNYFVPEDGDGLSPPARAARNFRVFSARFGNIYTTRQLLQLFDEAFGRRQPGETAWLRADGRHVDPYRPNIEPDGFADPAAVAAARAGHLGFVRTMFEQADVFVFTLGLTEGWRSRIDGSVFPLAPGVAGGSYDESRHAFVNFTVAEVEQDLHAFLGALRLVNPAIRVLLTVSPVPLMATNETCNVLVATTYSKAVLRVAAETVARAHGWVDYFPSFEIITGSFNHGAYYGEDGREVTPQGVAHAMRVFVNNYVHGKSAAAHAATPVAAAAPQDRDDDIVCDEEAIALISR